MVSTMFAHWQQANDSMIGIVAPLLVEQNLAYDARYLTPWGRIGFRRKAVPPEGILRDAIVVIASGCLIHRVVFVVAERTRAFAFLHAGWGGCAGAAGAGVSWGTGG